MNTAADAIPPAQIGPTGRQSFGFCVILGVFSTFFAEVISGSQLFVFFLPHGPLLVFPVYWLHSVVFAAIVVHRAGPPDWQKLFLAGALFGLYEAYLTKVVWTGWDASSETLRIADVAVIQTMALVLFWHCFLAFILPLYLVEKLCASSSMIEHALPRWLYRTVAARPFSACLLAAAVMGGFQGMNSPSPLHSIVSCLGGALVLWGAVRLWRRHGVRAPLDRLLPGGRVLVRYAIALSAMYVLYGLIMNRAALPPVYPGQVAVWGMYVVLIALLVRLARQAPPPSSEPRPPVDLSFRRGQWALLAAVLSLASATASWAARPFSGIVGLIVMLLGTLYGLWQLGRCVRRAVKMPVTVRD